MTTTAQELEDRLIYEEAIEALRPFSEMYVASHHMHDKPRDYPVYGINFEVITIGDLRLANQILVALGKE